MLGIGDVRDYIASLGIAANDHVYCGKLDGKLDKSIGVYPKEREGDAIQAVGGNENSSYSIKRISILVHWNKSVRETERVSNTAFDMLRDTINVTINGTHILFTDMKCPEPIPVDTDDNGIFEYVIELDIYYERQVTI